MYQNQALLNDHSIVQMTLLFGVNQEIKSDTTFEFFDDYLVATHGSGGKSIIPYTSILIITTVPKGSEPNGWKR